MSSIFGGSGFSTQGRFSNLNVNLPQQQLQQQQPTSTFSQQQQVNTQPLVGSGSTTQSFENPMENSKPSWFNNPRKRTIPQSIVKRSAKPGSPEGSSTTNNSGSSSGGKNDFGAIAFGSKKAPHTFNPSAKPTDTKDSLPHGILVDSNEAPPTKSLYDWQREDEFGAMLPPSHLDSTLHNQSYCSSKKTDTSSLPNVFDKCENAKTATETAEVKMNGTSSAASNRNESAVIVFGYPESISNQIIIHFSKFGNILEDFEALRGASGINAASLKLRSKHTSENNTPRKLPIFTGDGWIKLTYDSPSSALRALQENGVVYGGCLVGCVPYTKGAVEQLASCKIEKADDVGSFSVPSNSLIGNGLSAINGAIGLRNEKPNTQEPQGPEEKGAFFLPSNRIDLKDGKSLFVHNGPNPSHQNFLRAIESKMQEQENGSQNSNGVLGKVNNWLFGWNDL
ncbi:LAQU0S02e00474g1_1 [Lachancea quebecensis]|uniref:LAQU0S02e00474g1_1 n=1 Tax=Lachancea quebecensis TaxID=1654605 RepID=A0A0N7MKZ8_9SACH|nr:LAQU0S02e00474g1_1 [Lachancea quebecensis]